VETWTEQAAAVARLTKPAFVRLYEGTPETRTRKALLRARFRFRRGEFLRFVLPDLYNLPFNPFHRSILGRERRPWAERQGVDRLWGVAAPRGVAKTTLLKGELLHDVVYGLEGYVVILSAEMRLARSIARDVRSFLAAQDSALAQIYGPIEVQGGVEEFQARLPGGRWVGFLARSFGTQVRGANFEGQRPTRIAIDDGERPDRVRNPDQRAEWWKFLEDDILKAGPRVGGLEVDIRGTVLHTDAVLARVLQHPGWSSRRWQALEAWPERADLWEACGRIWKDLTLGDPEARRAKALAFYEAHRAEMDRGAKVLDEHALPLFRFYEEIWKTSLRSVLRDLQNTPTSGSARVFDTAKFHRCRVEGPWVVSLSPEGKELRRCKLADLRIALRLDPIPGNDLGGLGEDGGAGDGDPAAIAVVGREHLHGCASYGYVLDGWMKRAKDSEMLRVLFEMAERWKAGRVSIESNGFQRLVTRDFRRLVEERRKAGHWCGWALDEDVSTQNKDDRMGSLDVPCDNGWLLFSESIPRRMLAQFDDFPNADHDDFHDAVEGAYRASGGIKDLVATKPSQRLV